MSAWTLGTCTVQCGGGTKTKTRSIISQPADGKPACPELSETEACNTMHCTYSGLVAGLQNQGFTQLQLWDVFYNPITSSIYRSHSGHFKLTNDDGTAVDHSGDTCARAQTVSSNACTYETWGHGAYLQACSAENQILYSDAGHNTTVEGFSIAIISTAFTMLVARWHTLSHHMDTIPRTQHTIHSDRHIVRISICMHANSTLRPFAMTLTG